MAGQSIRAGLLVLAAAQPSKRQRGVVGNWRVRLGAGAAP